MKKFDPVDEINNTAHVQYIRDYKDNLIGYFLPDYVLENLLRDVYSKGYEDSKDNYIIGDDI